MKIVIAITLCYLLCRFIKPIWKALIVGAACYIFISFIVMTHSVPAGSKLNITSSSLSNFVAVALGEFIVYFALGFIIFLVFNKSPKQNSDIIENDNDAPKV